MPSAISGVIVFQPLARSSLRGSCVARQASKSSSTLAKAPMLVAFKSKLNCGFQLITYSLFVPRRSSDDVASPAFVGDVAPDNPLKNHLMHHDSRSGLS